MTKPTSPSELSQPSTASAQQTKRFSRQEFSRLVGTVALTYIVSVVLCRVFSPNVGGLTLISGLLIAIIWADSLPANLSGPRSV